MKNFITNIFLIVIVISSIVTLVFGQSKILIKKSNNLRLVEVLNRLEVIAETKTSNLSVRIYKIENEPGSAGYPNGEVTHNLLIAASEFDEYPLRSLFEIGPFFNPKFISWGGQDTQKEIVIEYGPPDKRKSKTLSVDIEELQIKN